MTFAVVCLHVVGIVGVFCQNDATAIGDCLHDFIDFEELGALYCVAQPEDIPARLMVYDPAIGGINCAEPCGLTADGSQVADCYDACVACPMGWSIGVGLTTTFTTPIAGSWECHDRGGAIQPTFGRVYIPGEGFGLIWYLPIDHMVRLPDGIASSPYWAGAVVWNWTKETISK